MMARGGVRVGDAHTTTASRVAPETVVVIGRGAGYCDGECPCPGVLALSDRAEPVVMGTWFTIRDRASGTAWHNGRRTWKNIGYYPTR
jgi:hypothetical protein